MSTLDICCDSKADLLRMSFLAEPLAKFKASLDDCLDPYELEPKNWDSYADVLAKYDDERHKVCRERLPEGKKVRRSEVFALAADRKNTSIATVCVAAMAWGGMRVDHFEQLCESSRGEWLDVAEQIREGKLTRAEAYARLKELRDEKKLKGMGPAFFTKLIYFLTPRDGSTGQTAYIMDQWAASSVNVLTGLNMVRMEVTPKSPRKLRKSSTSEFALSVSFTVSDKNTNMNYEVFCSTVDQLACRFRLNADQVDQALFGADAIGLGRWRRYVIHKRLQLLR